MLLIWASRLFSSRSPWFQPQRILELTVRSVGLGAQSPKLLVVAMESGDGPV